MNSEEYNKKFKHFRMVYVSDDGFWIDGREILRRLGETHYPRMYVEPRLKGGPIPVDDPRADLTAIEIVDRVYKPYKFRSPAPIPDAMVEWMVRRGDHKPKGA